MERGEERHTQRKGGEGERGRNRGGRGRCGDRQTETPLLSGLYHSVAPRARKNWGGGGEDGRGRTEIDMGDRRRGGDRQGRGKMREKRGGGGGWGGAELELENLILQGL